MMIITTMGRSQYFFRCLKNPQSSTMKSRTLFLLRNYSVLMMHVRCRPIVARNPVARNASVEASEHRVLACQPTRNADRYNEPVVQQTQDDPRIDPSQDCADEHPYLKYRSENLRKDQAGQQHGCGDNHGPPTYTLPSYYEGQYPDDAKPRGNDQRK